MGNRGCWRRTAQRQISCVCVCVWVCLRVLLWSMPSNKNSSRANNQMLMLMSVVVCRKHRRCAHMLHRRDASYLYLRAARCLCICVAHLASTASSMMTYIYAKQHHRPIYDSAAWAAGRVSECLCLWFVADVCVCVCVHRFAGGRHTNVLGVPRSREDMVDKIVCIRYDYLYMVYGCTPCMQIAHICSVDLGVSLLTHSQRCQN